MAPGMLHCSGGPGPSSFDMLAALERCVERNEAPDRVIATGPAAAGTRSRPLCRFPQVAVYSGRGSTDEAENFVCRIPASVQ